MGATETAANWLIFNIKLLEFQLPLFKINKTILRHFLRGILNLQLVIIVAFKLNLVSLFIEHF